MVHKGLDGRQDFFQKPIVDFPVVAKKIFPGEKVVKFHFTHSKLKKQSFFAKQSIGKYQISKSRRVKASLPLLTTPMHTRKQRPRRSKQLLDFYQQFEVNSFQIPATNRYK